MVRVKVGPVRLDRFLRDEFPTWSRADHQRAISGRHIRINSRVVWMSSWKVQPGDLVTVDDAFVLSASAPVFTWDDAWVLMQRDDVLAVNKPSGLRSESRDATDTMSLQILVNLRFGDGWVLAHRLDRDTSGVVLLTRPGDSRRALDSAFKAHEIEKVYFAVVSVPAGSSRDGVGLNESGRIVARIDADPEARDRRVVVERGGESALTVYRVIERRSQTALVELRPQTGRTHQLRVHLAHLGFAILGDRLYGDADSAPRLLLHAYQMTVPAISLSVTAPAPIEFE